MTADVGLLACGNGLGHVRRAVDLAAGLLEAGCKPPTIMCAAWQADRLARSTPMELLQRHGVAIRTFDSPVGWGALSGEGRRGLLDWNEQLARLELGTFDLVVSDNLVEPLTHSANVVLLASFFWHDLLRSAAPEDAALEQYFFSCERLLAEHRPVIITNRYFAMPSVCGRATHSVGMMRGLSASRRPHPRSGILFNAGSSIHLARRLAEHLDVWPVDANVGERDAFLADARTRALMQYPERVGTFDFDAARFDELTAVVTRPGLGILSDCIGAETPVFCIDEADPEMGHNAVVVETLGVGARLEDLSDARASVKRFLVERVDTGAFAAAAAEVDTGGIEQTVDILLGSIAVTAGTTQGAVS